MWVNYRFDRNAVVIGSVIVAWIAPLIVVLSDFSSVAENSFTLKIGVALMSYIVAFILLFFISIRLFALISNMQLKQKSGFIQTKD